MPTAGKERLRMAENFLKELTTPLARELAEYILLQEDLRACLATTTLWFAKYAGRKDELSDEERLMGLSLFRDSIVMFVGCFDKSAPLSLRAEDVYEVENGGLAFFKWLQDIRDSYAAHKFGPLRQSAVGVITNPAGDVIGSGHLKMIWAGPEAVAKDQFLSFIRVACRFVDRRIAEFGARLIEEAKAMKPEELASLKDARLRAAEPESIRMSREKFRRTIPDGDGT
jgi:hypothetical protein